MKKVTYTGDEVAEVDDGEYIHVLRNGGWVIVSNELGSQYEDQDGFTVRDTTKKKGDS